MIISIVLIFSAVFLFFKPKDSKEVYQKDNKVYMQYSPKTKQTMPSEDSTDTTLNLLLLNNPIVSGYIRELFELYQNASNGNMTGSAGPSASIEVLYGTHLIEGGTYPNTPIPVSYIPSEGGQLYWGKDYGGYNHSSMNLKSINHKMVRDSNYPSRTSGSISFSRPPTDSGLYTNIYQITYTYFQRFNGTSKAAQLTSLTPYGEPNDTTRKSDPYYLPDQLVYFTDKFQEYAKGAIDEDYMNSLNLPESYKDSIRAIIVSYIHNAGAGMLDRRAYMGFGSNLYPSGTSASQVSVSADVEKKKTYIDYALDLTLAYNKLPDGIPYKIGHSEDSKIFYLLIMPILNDNYMLNKNAGSYLSGNGNASKDLILTNYKQITGSPNVTWEQYASWLQTKVGEPPDQVSKYGVSHTHNDLAIWRESHGTVTRNGKTAKRYQIHQWITVRHNFVTAFSARQHYPLLLAYMGVDGVDPKDPSTYLNNLQKEGSPIVPKSPDIFLPGSSNLPVPSTAQLNVVENWVTYYNPRLTKYGMAGEVGQKDGMPIYMQSKGSIYETDPKYMIKTIDSRGNIIPTKSTLENSGCGMFTMTSIIHGIGLGRTVATTDMIKAIDDYGNKNGFLEPWELMEYNAKYRSTKFPWWATYNARGSILSANRYAEVLPFLGIPCKQIPFSNINTIRDELKKGYPIILSTKGHQRYTGYSFADREKGIVKKDTLRGDRLTGGGHIIAIYDVYTFKDTKGTPIEVVAIIDSGKEASRGINNKFIPLKEFVNQVEYAWLVQMPIIKAQSPTPVQSAPIITGNIPDQQYINNIGKDLFSLNFIVNPNSPNRVVYHIDGEKEINAVTGDYYEYQRISANSGKFTLYRNNVSYSMGTVRCELPETNQPTEFTGKVFVGTENLPSSITVVMHNVDDALNTVSPRVIIAEETNIY